MLVVAEAVRQRKADHHFSPRELLNFFESLRVPPPRNINQVLATLRQKALVTTPKRGRWTVTPIGVKVSRAFLQDGTDLAQIEASTRENPGSEFGHVRHSLLIPQFAPLKWHPAIERLTQSFPFENNVFLMTRFPTGSDRDDPLHHVVQALREALRKHGLHLHLASDRQLDDDLLGNVAAHMWACRYGIGILEDMVGNGLNLNVLTELGAMLITGRRCALLKDGSSPKLPTDLVGQIYKEVDLSSPPSVGEEVHRWAADDLGFGRCSACPTN